MWIKTNNQQEHDEAVDYLITLGIDAKKTKRSEFPIYLKYVDNADWSIHSTIPLTTEYLPMTLEYFKSMTTLPKIRERLFRSLVLLGYYDDFHKIVVHDSNAQYHVNNSAICRWLLCHMNNKKVITRTDLQVLVNLIQMIENDPDNLPILPSIRLQDSVTLTELIEQKKIIERFLELTEKSIGYYCQIINK